MTASQAQMYRDSITEYDLFNRNLYIQDSFTRNKMTINLGLRFDYQSDEAHEANVAAHPFYGKATYAGVYNGVTYTGAAFNQLPALDVPGRGLGRRRRSRTGRRASGSRTTSWATAATS